MSNNRNIAFLVSSLKMSNNRNKKMANIRNKVLMFLYIETNVYIWKLNWR